MPLTNGPMCDNGWYYYISESLLYKHNVHNVVITNITGIRSDLGWRESSRYSDMLSWKYETGLDENVRYVWKPLQEPVPVHAIVPIQHRSKGRRCRRLLVITSAPPPAKDNVLQLPTSRFRNWEKLARNLPVIVFYYWNGWQYSGLICDCNNYLKDYYSEMD